MREAGIALADGDLLRPESLPSAVRGVDAVVHCAAFSGARRPAGSMSACCGRR
jgi:UDP-glucose 4-epimerase